VIDQARWIVFLVAAVGLAIVPGPAVVFIVSRSVSYGRAAGIVSVLGMAGGSAVHVLSAAVGISVLLVTSSTAFLILKYLGALYLFSLGFRTMFQRQARCGAPTPPVPARPPYRVLLRQAFLVNLLNPKTTLFFFSFLPQFVNPVGFPFAGQVVRLGAIFIVVAVVTDTGYAWASGTAAHRLPRVSGLSRRTRWIAGLVYFLLGIAAIVGDVRPE
jgi:threonine/homoserine/homoserine lactone efflux protein